MPINKIDRSKRDERALAAYKGISSSKQPSKSSKDVAKNRLKTDSSSKDNKKINETIKTNTRAVKPESVKISKSKSETVKLETKSKPQKPVDFKAWKAENIKADKKGILPIKKSGGSSNTKISKGRGGNEESGKNVKLSESKSINETPKISRQDTFELPTVGENVDQQDDSVSYEQDFEDYESDFEVDEEDIDDTDTGENITDFNETNVSRGILEDEGFTFELGETSATPLEKHVWLSRSSDDDRGETSAKPVEKHIQLSENNEDVNPKDSAYQSPKFKTVVVEETPKTEIVEKVQERPKTGFRNFINFAASEETLRQKNISDKIRNRGIKLLQLLTLDTMNFDIFEMKPVKYSIFMLAFGSTNSTQVSCQTELDGSEAEVQTEEIKSTEKWTQHPPDCTNACGGISVKSKDQKIKFGVGGRLLKVLNIMSKTVEILLDEELVRFSSGKSSHESRSTLEICDGVLRLMPPQFMQGSSIKSIHCPDNNPYVILSTHQDLPELMNGHGVICVWDLLQPIKPKKLLVCATHPTCCCFASPKLSAVTAGAVDGSLMMWDLRELPSNCSFTFTDVPTQAPTYSVAGDLNINGHRSSIVDVKALKMKYNDAGAYDDAPMQMASLDESAVFIVWVVVEVKDSDDVRLAPDGHLMIVPSTRVDLNSLIDPTATTRVFSFETHPKEPHTFFVTTDLGTVINFKLHDSKVKNYKHSPDIPVDVTAISVCEQRRTCLLAGCSDGTVRLHVLDKENPIISWTKAANGAPVKMVQWSPSGPNIYFILDTAGQIHMWDLTYSDVHPCFSSDSKIARYECAVAGCDPRCLGKDGNFQPYLVLGSRDGVVEVHNLKENFSRCGKQETDLFNFYLDIL